MDGPIELPRMKTSMAKRVYTRSNKSLVNYDVWRAFDRRMNILSGKDPSVCKLMLPPALLKRAFGTPDPSEIGFAGSGTFTFEDTNLDMFKLVEYKNTQIYHGFPREPEFYRTKKNLSKPEHKRVKPWPTPDEFWKSDDFCEFKLMCNDLADWRKFRRWLRRHLNMIEENPEYDFDSECMAEWGENLDICLGDFDQKGVVNTEMAAYKFNNGEFMTKEEIDALPEEKKPVTFVPPKIWEFKKEDRIFVDKANLKVTDIQAEQESLSNFI